MSEVLGEYGSMIVEAISASVLLFFLQQLLFPAFMSLVETYISSIV